jgi:hypothetical protein
VTRALLVPQVQQVRLVRKVTPGQQVPRVLLVQLVQLDRKDRKVFKAYRVTRDQQALTVPREQMVQTAHPGLMALTERTAQTVPMVRHGTMAQAHPVAAQALTVTIT